VSVTPVKGPDGKQSIPAEAIASIKKNKIGLKGNNPISKSQRPARHTSWKGTRLTEFNFA
jgi:hypothetical protein